MYINKQVIPPGISTMFRIYFVLTLIVPLCVSRSPEITFRNVTFRGYSVFTEKFKKTIKSSNSLKDEIPDKLHDMIEFTGQEIPILYKDSLADLQHLDELIIESCGVYEIMPGALKNVPQLRRMSLKGNKIERIQNEVFNKLLISTLDLSQNSITTIDSEAFDDMPNLLNINLADNKISTWDNDWFKSTPLLTRISMQNNSITSLPANSFKNLKGAKTFGKVDLTINLVFSHNKIRKINPKAFVGLEKINNLWLDNNLLETFGDDLLTGVNVNDLRINSNQIKCLEGDFSKIFSAETTHIDDNPLDCECLENIKNWSKKNEKNIEWFYADMNCMVQRIRKKTIALEKRLKGLKNEPIK